MEELQRIARAHIPKGFYIVDAGMPLDDDLVWSWTTKEWMRADDPLWSCRRVTAEDCVMVIRNARTGTHTYTVRRPPPPPPVSDLVPVSTAGQHSLFANRE